MILEAYPPGVALFFFSVVASSVFAFVVIAGAYLRVAGRPHTSPGRATVALVLTCGSIPLAVSFRDSLWWVLGTDDGALAGLTVLVVIIAVATGALAFATEPLFRHRLRQRH